MNARDALDAATPLYWAVTQCDPRMVSLLLTAGADVEGVTMAGCRALWWAAWMGHEAITRLLLQAGADSNATDPLGKGFVGGLVGSVSRLRQLSRLVRWMGSSPSAVAT